MTPPPTYSTGLRAAAISLAASRICRLCGLVFGLYPGRSMLGGQLNVHWPCSTSLGISTSTAPGRPEEAMWNASASTCGISLPERTRKLCLVIGIVMPEMSASWKASVPISVRPTWPVTATTGIESIWASASGGDQVGGSGAGRRHADTDLAGGVRVAAGRVTGALLVADQHVAQLRRVEQRVIDRQHRTAGNAEDHLDVEFL